jgi:hypothetical protein
VAARCQVVAEEKVDSRYGGCSGLEVWEGGSLWVIKLSDHSWGLGLQWLLLSMRLA